MNRIVGNVIIVDSAMGNNVMLTSGNMAINLTEAHVEAVAFWSIDTTGVVVFAGANTTDQVVRLTNPNNTPTTVGIILNGVAFTGIKIPTLTAGTAWLYLK